jgi:hypothetical protein
VKDGNKLKTKGILWSRLLSVGRDVRLTGEAFKAFVHVRRCGGETGGVGCAARSQQGWTAAKG